jgi:polar amino acid transport system substrate-binding protein
MHAIPFSRALMIMLLAGLSAWSAKAGTPLQIATSSVAPYATPARDGLLDRLVPAVFRELGLEAEIALYPGASERGLRNANEGLDDGQALRLPGLEREYPNLVRVPEPLLEADFVAFTSGPVFATPGWSALLPYEVTYVIGWKLFENGLPQQVRRTPVRDVEQMFGLLANGRAEVALYERWQGLASARALGLKVQLMQPPLLSSPMYLYLHKKHVDLVPRAAEALARLKRNGSYQRIVAETLRP